MTLHNDPVLAARELLRLDLEVDANVEMLKHLPGRHDQQRHDPYKGVYGDDLIFVDDVSELAWYDSGDYAYWIMPDGRLLDVNVSGGDHHVAIERLSKYDSTYEYDNNIADKYAHLPDVEWRNWTSIGVDNGLLRVKANASAGWTDIETKDLDRRTFRKLKSLYDAGKLDMRPGGEVVWEGLSNRNYLATTTEEFLISKYLVPPKVSSGRGLRYTLKYVTDANINSKMSYSLSPWHATNIYSFAAKQIEQPDDLPEYITHLSEGTASYEQQIRDAWQNLKDHPTEANAQAFIQLMIIYSKDLWPEVLANVLGIEVDDLTSEQLDLLNERLSEHHNYITTSLAPDIIRYIKDGKDLSSLDYRTTFLYAGALWAFGSLATVMFDGLSIRDLADLFVFIGPNDEATCTGERGCAQYVGKIYTVAQILADGIIPGQLRCLTNCRHFLLPIASPLTKKEFGTNGAGLKHLPGRHDQQRHAPHKGVSSGSYAAPSRPEEVRTLEDLRAYSEMLPAEDDNYDYFTHAVRNRASLDAIAEEGLNPAAGSGKLWASKPPLVRDLGAGYLVFRAPKGEATHSMDVVERGLVYDEYTFTRTIPPSDIVKVVPEIPLVGTQHTLRADLFADYTYNHQGNPEGERVDDLPEMYQGWFDLPSVSTKHLPGRHPQSRHAPHSSNRAWSGQQHPKVQSLTKLKTGELGEQVAIHALQEAIGAEFRTVNVGLNNAPIDVIGDHTAVEVKTGLASNSTDAQKWRATIGQPGKAEAAALKQMTTDEKRIHNRRKMDAIMQRKQDLVKEFSDQVGTPIQPKTVGVILNPEGTKADVFVIDGFHETLRWNTYATDEYYLGTYDVDAVQSALKHLPGRHDQQRHAPHKVTGEYKEFGPYGPTSSWLKAGATEPTEAEEKAISRYQGQGYFVINGYLRGLREGTEEAKEAAETIDGYMERSTVHENVIAYKGMQNGVLAQAIDVGKDLSGMEIVDKGYVSTSIDKYTIGQFSGTGSSTLREDGHKFGEYAVEFELKVPAGTHAALRLGPESEIILARGSRFVVTGSRMEKLPDHYRSEFPRRVIEAEVVQ